MSYMAEETRHREPVNEVELEELDLFANNTAELYPQKQAILQNIERRLDKGTYDPAKAPKLWLYWIDRAAKDYSREFPGAHFSPATREALAQRMAHREYSELMIQRGAGNSERAGRDVREAGQGPYTATYSADTFINATGERIWPDGGAAERGERRLSRRKPRRMSREDYKRRGLDSFTSGYAVASLWSSTDNSRDNGGDPLDDKYGVDHIADDTLEQMRRDCAKFQRDNEKDLDKAYNADVFVDGRHYNAHSAGFDFWLTRNEHGAGFWDRGLGAVGDRLTEAAEKYGTFDLYVQDGKVHGEPLERKGVNESRESRPKASEAAESSKKEPERAPWPRSAPPAAREDGGPSGALNWKQRDGAWHAKTFGNAEYKLVPEGDDNVHAYYVHDGHEEDLGVHGNMGAAMGAARRHQPREGQRAAESPGGDGHRDSSASERVPVLHEDPVVVAAAVSTTETVTKSETATVVTAEEDFKTVNAAEQHAYTEGFRYIAERGSKYDIYKRRPVGKKGYEKRELYHRRGKWHVSGDKKTVSRLGPDARKILVDQGAKTAASAEPPAAEECAPCAAHEACERHPTGETVTIEQKVDKAPCSDGTCVPWLRVERDTADYEKRMEKAKAIGPIETPQQVFDLLAGELGKNDQEVFVVVCLDLHGHLRGVFEVARGQRSKVSVGIQDVMRPILLTGCEGAVIAHAHPSNNSSKPSAADRQLTKDIQEALKPFEGECTLIDHVVLTTDSWYSILGNERSTAAKRRRN
jgi:hypothetical protein